VRLFCLGQLRFMTARLLAADLCGGRQGTVLMPGAGSDILNIWKLADARRPACTSPWLCITRGPVAPAGQQCWLPSGLYMEADNRDMSVTGQAGNPESTLSVFLDARLPQRDVVAQAWARQVEAAPWSGIDTDPGYRRQLGNAIEIRIGLDVGAAATGTSCRFSRRKSAGLCCRRRATARTAERISRILGPPIRCCWTGYGSATRSLMVMTSKPF
jgi:hypothetical protein